VPAQNAMNYILCHVRKVTYKKNDKDGDSDVASSEEMDMDLSENK
jgi:hypothetical protein